MKVVRLSDLRTGRLYPQEEFVCRVFILLFLRQTTSLGNSVAAILLFLFMVHTSLAPVLNLLYFYISIFRSMCAVPNMAVFCSSLISWILLLLLLLFGLFLIILGTTTRLTPGCHGSSHSLFDTYGISTSYSQSILYQFILVHTCRNYCLRFTILF
jgi:ABC-type transport system involved in multi-copper enzyme maturation permease subunit